MWRYVLYSFKREILHNKDTLEIVACGRQSSDLAQMKSSMNKDTMYWAIYDLGAQLVFIIYNPDKANGANKQKILSQKDNFK